MPLAWPRATLIDLALPSEAVKASPAAAALAAAISQTNWHFALGGHEREVSSAASRWVAHRHGVRGQDRPHLGGPSSDDVDERPARAGLRAPRRGDKTDPRRN